MKKLSTLTWNNKNLTLEEFKVLVESFQETSNIPRRHKLDNEFNQKEANGKSIKKRRKKDVND